MNETSEIRIAVVPTQQAGGCNACTRTNTDGSRPYRKVVEVRLRGLSFRLCRSCLALLLPQLRATVLT